MNTTPSLSLTCEQASRLQAYLQAYRRYAVVSLIASTDRNNTLRFLQTIQGKLVAAMDQHTAWLQLILTTEEMTTLKTIITALLSFYAKEPASAERSATLADLAALKAMRKGY